MPSSRDEECLEKVLEDNSGCLTACTGLHADVRRVDDRFFSLYETNKQMTSQTLQKVSEILASGDTKFYWYNLKFQLSMKNAIQMNG